MLSIIICTWNRSDSLRRTLQSLVDMHIAPALEWEVVVVDNNSTDDTAKTIDDFRERLPLRHEFEPKAGKSHALNTAVGIANGEHLLFTDDDVVVDRNWLGAYHDAFERHPQASLFGGPIEPRFLGEDTPPWLIEGMDTVANAYAAIPPAAATGAITTERYPYGANMATSRAVFDTHRFPVEVGPRPGSKVRGEEMLLIWEVLESGGVGQWVPDARVEHMIPPARQTLAYLRDYYLGSGELSHFTDRSDVRQLLGRPRWAWREAVGEQLRYLLTRYTRPAPIWLGHFRRAQVARGLLDGFKTETRG